MDEVLADVSRRRTELYVYQRHLGKPASSRYTLRYKLPYVHPIHGATDHPLTLFAVAYNKILLGNISQIAKDFRSITVENNITIWNLPPSLTNLGIGTTFLGHHFFQPNVAGVSAPVFDFRPSGAGDFVQGARNQSAPSPFNATSAVPWVKLDGIAGQAADTFFRVDTTGGALSQTSVSSGKLDGQRFS